MRIEECDPAVYSGYPLDYLGRPRRPLRRGVYALFDGNVCLYVGQAVNLDRRIWYHLRPPSTRKPFADRVTSVKTWCLGRATMLSSVERALILRLRPTYNKSLQGRPKRNLPDPPKEKRLA